MRNVTVRMEPEVVAEIERRAREHGMTVSQLMRRALDEHLARHGEET